MSLSKGPGFFLRLEERLKKERETITKPTCCRITDPCSEACVDDWLEWEKQQSITKK